MTTSVSQARANKKWRENNREKFNAICAESMRINYQKNKLKKSKYSKGIYLFKKECEIFRNIEIN